MDSVPRRTRLTYYSSTLLETAFHHARELKLSDALCQVPIIMASASVEAFLNDLEYFLFEHFGDSPDERNAAVRSMLKRVEQSRGTTQLKIEVAHFGYVGEPVDKGRQPFQNFDLLVKIRNALVHTQPIEVNNFDDPEHNAGLRLRSLVAQGIIEEPPAKTLISWRDLVETPHVAKWACNSALQIVHFLIQHVPNRPASWIGSRFEQIEAFEL